VDEQISRRNFFRGVGATAMASALAKAAAVAQAAEALDDQKPVGPGPTKLILQVNGSRAEVAVEPRETLLDVLRNRLQLTGAKEVCDRATCGGCTVLVNGQPIYACMKLAVEMEGQEILTVEGLGDQKRLNAVQQAFIECDALMCGYCTPGFVMSLTALFNEKKNPTPAEIKKACSGNLCRCGTYPQIFKAAQKVAESS
jgi:xanthine dehydrogenase YagT iron-sulfur-binding subunit